MKKEIYFCLDYKSFYSIAKGVSCSNYANTEEAIREECPQIRTLSIAHLQSAFDLIDKGYSVYLCYKENKVKVVEGMELRNEIPLSAPTYYDDMDLLDYFRGGYFDELLGYDDKQIEKDE